MERGPREEREPLKSSPGERMHQTRPSLVKTMQGEVRGISDQHLGFREA